MTRPNTAATRFEEFGFSAFTYRRATAVGERDDRRTVGRHTHLEIELHFVERGALILECAGREERVEQGQVLAFWGGLPHRDIDPEPPLTVYHVAQIPVVSVLSWARSSGVVDRLLHGELLKAAPSSDTRADELAFARWSTDLADGDPYRRAAAEMEVQARLLRLVHDAPVALPMSESPGSMATAALVAGAVRFVTRHFVEHITIDDVARAVDRHRHHVMASFRRTCGLTVWEFLTRLRVSEAQRLLATTDLPILAVCHRVGFSSTSRMYEAFHRFAGATPATYRQHATNLRHRASMSSWHESTPYGADRSAAG